MQIINLIPERRRALIFYASFAPMQILFYNFFLRSFTENFAHEFVLLEKPGQSSALVKPEYNENAVLFHARDTPNVPSRDSSISFFPRRATAGPFEGADLHALTVSREVVRKIRHHQRRTEPSKGGQWSSGVTLVV